MDKSDENKEKKAVSPDGQSIASREKKRTIGNIIYDFGVFGTIAWLGVAALSAFSAHEAQYGKNKYFGWLRTINDKASSGITKMLSTTILKDASPKTIEGYAKGTTMFLTLGMGGNALMAPIKWLEDNRQSNAALIDKALGTTPPDPETVAHEPKQTWKSVLSGRLISWGTSYLAFLAMGPALTGKISNWFGDHTTKAWMKMKPASNPQTVRKWADIAAFDVLFTVITASLTYMCSRSIAQKNENHQAQDGLHEVNVISPVATENAIEAHIPKRHEHMTQHHHDPQFAKKITRLREIPTEMAV